MSGITSSLAAPKRLEGKVAIITGGASGIGEGVVNLFHENGAKGFIADIQDELGQAIANRLSTENFCYIHCDVSNENDVIKRLLAVNLVGAFLGAKHAARVMIPNRNGCILFTTSACTEIAGLATHPYAATKYGILGLAKNLTPELGHCGIRVNCVSPYGLVTAIGRQRAVTEEERHQAEALLSGVGNLKGQVLRVDGIAKAALYLSSDEAYYVSGMNLVVDGGFSVVNPSLMKGTIYLGPGGGNFSLYSQADHASFDANSCEKCFLV